jgi:putative FmdB family regulatory protein
MPIYAFECAACGHHFERLQRLSDADPSECPECAAAQVRRQLTAPSFRLAGGGWYETDFKKDGKRNLAEKGDAPKAEAAKAESKPAEAPKPAAPKAAE